MTYILPGESYSTRPLQSSAQFGVTPPHLNTVRIPGNIVGEGPQGSLNRIVKFDEENIVDEGIDNLFHDFGHSDKEDSINNGVNHTKEDYKPVQVKMYGLDRHPHSKTDFVTLTVDPPVAQEEPVPLSATQTHGEAGINRKKPNIPAPPGGNVKTRTNIATFR